MMDFRALAQTVVWGHHSLKECNRDSCGNLENAVYEMLRLAYFEGLDAARAERAQREDPRPPVTQGNPVYCGNCHQDWPDYLSWYNHNCPPTAQAQEADSDG